MLGKTTFLLIKLYFLKKSILNVFGLIFLCLSTAALGCERTYDEAHSTAPSSAPQPLGTITEEGVAAKAPFDGHAPLWFNLLQIKLLEGEHAEAEKTEAYSLLLTQSIILEGLETKHENARAGLKEILKKGTKLGDGVHVEDSPLYRKLVVQRDSARKLLKATNKLLEKLGQSLPQETIAQCKPYPYAPRVFQLFHPNQALKVKPHISNKLTFPEADPSEYEDYRDEAECDIYYTGLQKDAILGKKYVYKELYRFNERLTIMRGHVADLTAKIEKDKAQPPSHPTLATATPDKTTMRSPARKKQAKRKRGRPPKTKPPEPSTPPLTPPLQIAETTAPEQVSLETAPGNLSNPAKSHKKKKKNK